MQSYARPWTACAPPPCAYLPIFPTHLPKPHFMLNGDIMNGMMGRIFGENRTNGNTHVEKDYESRPVKFVMERKNVWRVVWAD